MSVFVLFKCRERQPSTDESRQHKSVWAHCRVKQKERPNTMAGKAHVKPAHSLKKNFKVEVVETRTLHRLEPHNIRPSDFTVTYSFCCVFEEGGEVAAATVASMASHYQSQWEFSCDFEVDFQSQENASIVYAALAVDKELQPDKVQRQMTVSDGKLSVHFEAVEARFLRASLSALVDVLTLATKTLEEFGQKMAS
ncbi:uncharacterized protein LOC119984167 isoform X2 [Tripterygium wilfordii]|uniref:uncharacterized protein LOC119984167 isoform X2 n=1 Tax=Tripterygium wilfordii TaxID=458696 RepID=UPI0018F7F921|nr:uncharacterized protein LOC119984167 isoform X2 [Tripterygium wilfordii]